MSGFGQDLPLIYPTPRAEVLDGTFGDFVTDNLAENGFLIPIIGQLSVNDIVQFLGLSDQSWGNGLSFITNLLAHAEATGWVSFNNSNQNWVGGSTIPIALKMSPGLLTLTPVLLTCCGVLDVHAPPDAASATISVVAVIRRVCGANLIIAIPWSIHGLVGGGKTGMVRYLNNLGPKFPLLV